MKNLRDCLNYDYKINASKSSKGCIPLNDLSDYAEGSSSRQERELIEKHIADCYYCLDKVVSVRDGINFINKRKGFKLKKEHLLLSLTILCFALSFILSKYFLQFLAATIILGIKWIVDSKSSRMLITVHKALRQDESDRAFKDQKETRIRKLF